MIITRIECFRRKSLTKDKKILMFILSTKRMQELPLIAKTLKNLLVTLIQTKMMTVMLGPIRLPQEFDQKKAKEMNNRKLMLQD